MAKSTSRKKGATGARKPIVMPPERPRAPGKERRPDVVIDPPAGTPPRPGQGLLEDQGPEHGSELTGVAFRIRLAPIELLMERCKERIHARLTAQDEAPKRPGKQKAKRNKKMPIAKKKRLSGSTATKKRVVASKRGRVGATSTKKRRRLAA